MIKAEVEGTIKDIIYKSEKSCKFIIINQDKELLCTITKRNIDLMDTIKEGQSFKLKGTIRAFTKANDKGKFIDNVFYVDDLEGIEKVEVKQ